MHLRVRKGVEMEDTLIQATAENPSGQTQAQDEEQPPLSPPFRSNEDIRGRVIGGSLADVKQFPWQAGISEPWPILQTDKLRPMVRVGPAQFVDS